MSNIQMPVPYQCLDVAGDVLIAARGSSIYCFSLQDYSLLSIWKSEVSAEPAAPPAKRRKVSHTGGIQDPDGKKKINSRLDAVASGLELPAVSALAASKSGDHVVAVTGEDKSIRVFENAFEEGGKHRLQQISRRAMPKRPCAIAVTDDGCTIITADKFGDVYSLPLLVSTGGIRLPTAITAPDPQPNLNKSFVPAANDLTVHSQRNRRALENQKRQTNKPSEKSEPDFEHNLLLGHVSMLTDIALVTMQQRRYIITADRDEHIRISRGIPQAHIIEGFCLGHTEFVSRLCIPAGRSNILLSAGGEDYIFVWQWLSGELLSKTNLRGHVEAVLGKPEGTTATKAVKFAVSGLSHIKLEGEDGIEDVVVVTCEGVPALISFVISPDNTLRHIQTVPLPGNALNTVVGPSNMLIVSVDCIHNSGSSVELRGSFQETISSLQSYIFQDLKVLSNSGFEEVEGEVEHDGEKASTRWTNLLYNLENLRKRDGDAREEE